MTDPAILVRPATAIDLSAMVALLGELFALEADFTPDAQAQARGLALLLADGRARLLVAEAGGQVVGMCSGQLLVSTAEGAPAAVVEDVVVRRDWRGRGVGRALLDAVAAWAAGRGAWRLQLLADRHNLPALAFYERTGFSSTQLVCLRRREIPGA
jgi:GNAT superfamily N-acetyltransferase